MFWFLFQVAHISQGPVTRREDPCPLQDSCGSETAPLVSGEEKAVWLSLVPTAVILGQRQIRWAIKELELN